MSDRQISKSTAGVLPQIAPELLRSILSTATDIAIVVDDAGVVLSILTNPNHDTFGAVDHWQGRDLREFLTVESVPKFETYLDLAISGSTLTQTFELNHADGANWRYPIRYTLHPLGDTNGRLLLGRDLTPIAEVQQELVKAHIALERDQESQREFDTRYRVLMSVSLEAFVLVSLRRGRVVDANAAAASLIGASRDKIVGADFTALFEGDVADMTARIGASTGGDIGRFRLRQAKQTVLVAPTVFRTAGERLAFCRLEPIAAGEAGGGDLAETLRSLYDQSADAIAFCDAKGAITAANDAFLTMVEANDLNAIRGRTLAEHMLRGGVDMNILMENAANSRNMRMYSTKIVGAYGAETPVEISATYITEGKAPVLACIVRDVSRVEVTRGDDRPLAAPTRGSVSDVVGSRDLKNIVAETTEVIEKMCIEAALDMTQNNRVAAAEMLGLSRQSLYVKLRKYDILDKSADS